MHVLQLVALHAAVSHVALTAALGFASWPVILAAGCGFLATHITALLTHRNAPQWLKSGINLVLVSLAGVLIAVQVVPGSTWKDYLGLIVPAWLTSLATHYAGFTQWITNAAGNVGIGANTPPLVPPQSSQNSINAADPANATSSPAPTTDPTFPPGR
jgi:hypothetical protein